MAEIAKTAGMSAGHIYNLFENKDDVIAAIVERDRDEIVRRIEETLDGDDVAGAMLAAVEDSFHEPQREATACDRTATADQSVDRKRKANFKPSV